ncbi:MAG TPA: class I SAM-dependent methyltransferase [Oligoflexus sp.]|uniref:class I SAM-dependent methyltransferase n=1 Tax=Oligoflexus sp. TaxID=1971216 RepID=UPI002D4E2915|nr:class I SAM-dependent methyltransferase [Oligoflexus sp.]HYX34593.1 class I SAM-dependent methyltransferase [Oligoflexus sp.]
MGEAQAQFLIRSRAYENFMQNESWRGAETRFGYSQDTLKSELSRILGWLHSKNIAVSQIAEYGCGTGLHLIDIAKCFPKARCWGFEPAANMFEFSVKNVVASRSRNIQVLKFAIEDIPEVFEGTFDLSFSILVAGFVDDLEDYLRRLFQLAASNSLVYMFEMCVPPGLNRKESAAVRDYFDEVIEAKAPVASLDHILEISKNLGFKIYHRAENSERLASEKARNIHLKKDPRRADQEAAICLRHGLEPFFLSSLPLVQQLCFLKPSNQLTA